MNNEIRLVAIGDSIIKGTADNEKGGWVERVVEELNKSNSALVLYKKGVGGDTSKDVLSRIQSDCIDLNPDIIIIGVGVNDSRRRESLGNVTEVPLPEFEQNLTKIVEGLKTNSNAQILLSGMVPVDHRGANYKKDKTHFRADQFEYEKVIERVAQRHQLRYLDNFHRWLKYGDETITSMLLDGVHPSSRGHAEIADASTRLMTEVLSSLKTKT
jgi:acyl-CoA thioesterase-1